MRLERTLHWLSIRPTWSELGNLLANLFVLNVLWSIIVSCAFGLGEYVSAMLSDTTETWGSYLVHEFVRDPQRMFVALVAASFTEEVLFRFFPLSITLLYIWWRPHKAHVVFVVVPVVSAVFGLMHAGNYDVVTFKIVCRVLLFQGVAGILFSIIFLKYAGMRFRYVIGALCASTMAHILWNSFVIIPMAVVIWLG